MDQSPSRHQFSGPGFTFYLVWGDPGEFTPWTSVFSPVGWTHLLLDNPEGWIRRGRETLRIHRPCSTVLTAAPQPHPGPASLALGMSSVLVTLVHTHTLLSPFYFAGTCLIHLGSSVPSVEEQSIEFTNIKEKVQRFLSGIIKKCYP